MHKSHTPQQLHTDKHHSLKYSSQNPVQRQEFSKNF